MEEIGEQYFVFSF